jgi:release factor glutamine methyltransferase
VTGTLPPWPPPEAPDDAPMTQPTLIDLVQKSAAWLQTKGLPNHRREAEWIFSETLGLSRLELYTRFDMPLGESDVVRLRERVARRGKREPLAYVLGSQPFRALKLAVSPAVLVPRPETEELVDLILRELPSEPCRILDVGTGSGALALALKQSRPDCSVEATDVSAEALVIAKANAQTHTLEVAFHHGHLAEHLAGPYAVVVANLPYIAEHERHLCDPELGYEPAMALFAGADGLDLIRPLVADARRLCPGGTLWLEHGWQQGEAITALATQLGLTCTIIDDSAGKGRFARIQA